ncbi:MAG: metallophosphoesterase family protein [Candidatus Lokiarchaeota archaeon]|jgi:putative phosphoesterase
MVKYGIISDTHFTLRDEEETLDWLFDQLTRIFKDVDMIIHAGDLCHQVILNKLNSIAPTKAVAGECDEIEDLTQFLEFSGGKYKIGVIHEKPSNLKDFFHQKKIHILIFGHSHQPSIEATLFNTLLINPGSPTKPTAPPQKLGFSKPIARPSVITINIDENNILSTYLINLKV